jgi:hypothetical protein
MTSRHAVTGMAGHVRRPTGRLPWREPHKPGPPRWGRFSVPGDELHRDVGAVHHRDVGGARPRREGFRTIAEVPGAGAALAELGARLNGGG